MRIVRFALLVIALVLVPSGGALLVFGAVSGAVLVALAAMLFVLIFVRRVGGRRVLILSCMAVALMVAAIPLSANRVTSSMRALGDRALSLGPESLAVHERAALWILAVALAPGGVVVAAPHTALAQARILFPGANAMSMDSDYPMRSGMVRSFVTAQRGEGTFKMPLNWRNYYQEFPAHGVALLFNGGELRVTRRGDACLAEAWVSVSYKPQYRRSTLLLLGDIRFAVDQAAFWALQEVGWLFPYDLTYRWRC